MGAVEFGEPHVWPPRDFLEAVGVLVYRSNSWEHGLWKLWQFVRRSADGAGRGRGNHPELRSQNVVTLVRRIQDELPTLHVSGTELHELVEALDDVRDLADRRNAIIHGPWVALSPPGSVSIGRLAPPTKGPLDAVTFRRYTADDVMTLANDIAQNEHRMALAWTVFATKHGLHRVLWLPAENSSYDALGWAG